MYHVDHVFTATDRCNQEQTIVRLQQQQQEEDGTQQVRVKDDGWCAVDSRREFQLAQENSELQRTCEDLKKQLSQATSDYEVKVFAHDSLVGR